MFTENHIHTCPECGTEYEHAIPAGDVCTEESLGDPETLLCDECQECGSLGSQACAPDCTIQRVPDTEGN